MTDLSVLADADGHFTIAALDHRDALAVELQKVAEHEAAASTSDQAMVDFKRSLLQALDDRPSAVMLEPEYSLPELATQVGDGVGITCALEQQGYFADPLAGNTLLEGWHPGRVTEVGAHAAKLLVLYHHDRGEFTKAQDALVASVVEQAADADVPALIEPVPTDASDDAERAEIIIASAKRLGPMGPMLLKLPFPGAGRCEELNDACADKPWALLSWGVPFDEYVEQLGEACAAGCSGFTAGRALWREAVPTATRSDFLATTLLERFDALANIVESASPWTQR